MDFKNLLTELNEAMAVEAFKDDGHGACRVVVEGLVVTLLDIPAAHRLLTTATIGPVPEAGRDQFYATMLKAMHLAEGTSGAFFSIDPEANTICLTRQDVTSWFEAGQFADIFENFINICLSWRQMLSEFTPVMKELEAIKGEETETHRELLPHEVLHV